MTIRSSKSSTIYNKTYIEKKIIYKTEKEQISKHKYYDLHITIIIGLCNTLLCYTKHTTGI